MFKKFTDVDNEASAADDDHVANADAIIEESVPENLRRPLTRSSVKPRLLFPSPQQAKVRKFRDHNTEDEEADTDIEDPLPGISTPVDQVDDMGRTPKAPRFAPATPPTSSRATRSKKVDMSTSPAGLSSEDDSETSPLQVDKHGKISPFDQWIRVKNPDKGSKKRTGETITRGGIKRLRG